VQDNVRWLREHPGEDLPWGGPIRVFRKQAFMDKWGPLARDSFVGDPVNLENGEIDVPMKTDEVVGVVKEVVTERMGLQLGKVQVRIKHAPYQEEA
jgi:hypothetical protein